MKCLSVSQPYADLIINGTKTIEIRTWNTKFRGEFLVHAPLKVKTDACERLGIDKTRLRTGVIIGKVELYDVKVYSSILEFKDDYRKHLASEDFANHKYGFMLRKSQQLAIPIPHKGSLGFFEFNAQSKVNKDDLRSELFDEEYRYQWIGKH